jgi:hypothetical protein
MIVKIVLFSLVFMLLSLFLFIKIKFRFWSTQPVFHIYNVKHWIAPCGIVQHDSPPITKYYDYQIYNDIYTNIPAEKKALMVSLIRRFFLYKRDVKYTPSTSDIFDYFESQNDNSYISLCFEYLCEYNKTTNTYKNPKKLVGCMSSRTLECKIHDQTIKTSYVDFLCVHKNYRKKGYAPKIIYTHYKKSRDAGAHPIFLFKREGNINFIVPLTVYYAYAFSSKIWNRVNVNLPSNVTCVLVTAVNIELLFHFFREIKNSFTCFISPVYSNLKYQVTKGLLIPVLLMDKETPIGCYFFKNPQTSYNGRKSIECLASYITPGLEAIFTDSFSNAITLVRRQIPFEMFIIENISNNNYIIKEILKKSNALWKVPMAYYFYNFIYRPFFSPNVFLLN